MERVFACHNWPGLDAGTVAVHHGPAMSTVRAWLWPVNARTRERANATPSV